MLSHPKTGKDYQWQKRKERGLMEKTVAGHKVFGIEVYYKDDKGRSRPKRQWFAGKTRREVKDLLEKARTLKNEGKWFELQNREKEVVHFDTFAADVLNTYDNKSKTYRGYKSIIKDLVKYFKDIDLRKITVDMVRLYRNARLNQHGKKEARMSLATVNRSHAILKLILNRAIEQGFIERNPAKFIEIPSSKETKRIRYFGQFESDDKERFLQACKKSKAPWLYGIVITGFNTGMRIGEILNLKWDDVDLSHRIITVRKSKSGKSRQIPMTETLTETLRYCKIPEAQYVFCTETEGEQIYSIRRSFNTAARIAKLRDFHIHDMRHDFASQCVMRGVDLLTVKELLGHSTIAQTERYAHLAPDHKAHAIRVLDSKRTDTLQTFCNTGESSNIKNVLKK